MTEPEMPNIDPFDAPADRNVQGTESDYLEEGKGMTSAPLFNFSNPNVARKFNDLHKKLIDELPDFDSLPPVQ